jgi:hypothetical protein
MTRTRQFLEEVRRVLAREPEWWAEIRAGRAKVVEVTTVEARNLRAGDLVAWGRRAGYVYSWSRVGPGGKKRDDIEIRVGFMDGSSEKFSVLPEATLSLLHTHGRPPDHG